MSRHPIRCVLAVATALLALPSGAAAQCRMDLVESGIEAYRNLDLDVAADRFAEAVDANGSAQCATSNARALTYFGATLWLAQQPDSAMRAFQRAVIQAPRFRPDPVEFPPAVTDLFDRVRRETPAVAVTLPEEAEIGPDGPDQALTMRLSASIEHPIAVAVRSAGTTVRTLYEGVVAADARGTVVEWNGLGEGDQPVETGWYDLEIVSTDTRSRPVRKIVVALGVESDAPPTTEPEMVEVVDTIETTSENGSRLWKGIGMAGAGLVGGAAVVGIPYAVDSRSGSWTRYPVAVSLSVAGIVGLIRSLGGGEPAEARVVRRLVPAEQPPAPPPTLLIRPAYERRVELDPLAAVTNRGDGSASIRRDDR